MDPLEARHAVVQAGGKGSHFRSGGGVHRVAEINHCHRDAAGGNHAAPRFVVAQVARTELHTAAVNVENARHGLVVVRPDVLDLDGVSVGRGGEGLGAHGQAGRGGDV